MISPGLKFENRPTRHKVVCATRDNYVVITRLGSRPSREVTLDNFMSYIETLPLHYLERVIIMFDDEPGPGPGPESESDFRRRMEAAWVEARTRLHQVGLN